MNARRLLAPPRVGGSWTDRFAVFVLVFIALSALLINIVPHTPYAFINLSLALQPPSISAPFGTDVYGRNILVGILEGSSDIVLVVLATVGASTAVGGLIGVVSAYVGGLLDQVMMRLIDIILVFPSILLALAVVSVLGASLTNAVIAMAIAQVGPMARLVRSLVLSAKEMAHVENARSVGLDPIHIITRHVLPQVSGPILVQMTFATGVSILGVASLGFLGVGAQPPTADWGLMLYENQTYLTSAPYTVIFPGLAIFAVVFASNVVGEALRDHFDPRLRPGLHA